MTMAERRNATLRLLMEMQLKYIKRQNEALAAEYWDKADYWIAKARGLQSKIMEILTEEQTVECPPGCQCNYIDIG
jgi:hypothetical protein